MATNADLIAAVANLKLQNAVNSNRIRWLKDQLKAANDAANAPVPDDVLNDILGVATDLQNGPDTVLPTSV